jgi:tRNA dimethylallyltransferase
MMKNGLVEEVQGLLDRGYEEDLVSMRAIGYKEIVDGIKGRMSWEDTIETLKMNSRRYAKRQLTWFRRDERIQWFDLSEYGQFPFLVEKLLDYIAENL